MERKTVTWTMLTLLLASMFTFAIHIGRANPTTITVPDDYPAIQEAINAANEGDTVFVRSGTYYVYDYLVLNKSISLVGENKETTHLVCHARAIWVTVDDVTLAGFTIGRAYDLARDSTIRLSYVNNCNISENKFIGYYYRAIDLDSSSNNIITRNYMDSLYDCGIGLYNSPNNVVTENNIVNNIAGISLIGSSNNLIAGNNIRSGYASRRYGVYLVTSSNNIITGNNITAYTDYSGIYCSSSSNITISENTIANNWNGIDLESSSNIIIIRNNINDNHATAIRFGASNSSIIENNIQFDYTGIYITGSNNRVFGNDIKRIQLFGVSSIILGGSSNNVSGNKITYNNGGGIELRGSSNVISANEIANNSRGINLNGGSSNRIFHNNLRDNLQQVFPANSLTNIWDDGYPSGGNYWSDYSSRYPTVEDEYQGANQDAPGSDWIWDTPYEIDTVNEDRYPLTNPWEDILPVPNAGLDQTVYEDTLVTFDGSGSSDNVGIRSYMWTFTDVASRTLTGANPTYTFNTPGVYIVTLNVTDASGNRGTDTVIITILTALSKDLTQKLIETIELWRLPKGTKESLASKLEDALLLLDIGNNNGATHKLMDFISQVEALGDKKLNNAQSDYLETEAQRIIGVINE